VQKVVREIQKQEYFSVTVLQYIYPNQTVIRCASYINEKEAFMWVSRFFPHGEIKKERKYSCPRRRNAFLSNRTGPSNSTQQWGLKSPEEKLVKDEITGYNEG
jgi:hypothetical protein